MMDADSGSVRLGTKVHIGYYDQEHQILHPDKTLFQELQDAYPSLNNTQIRDTLAAFLFTGDDVFKLVSDLSGGERGRLSLAKLMLSEANFLILDEPTNHLDILSKEILEDAICRYTGTVLCVSHDRWFINRTATRILDLTGRTLIEYQGNYDYYLEKHEELTHRFLSPEAQTHSSGGTIASGNASHLSMQHTPAAADSEGRQDWKKQKEEQALERPLWNPETERSTQNWKKKKSIPTSQRSLPSPKKRHRSPGSSKNCMNSGQNLPSRTR